MSLPHLISTWLVYQFILKKNRIRINFFFFKSPWVNCNWLRARDNAGTRKTKSPVITLLSHQMPIRSKVRLVDVFSSDQFSVIYIVCQLLSVSVSGIHLLSVFDFFHNCRYLVWDDGVSALHHKHKFCLFVCLDYKNKLSIEKKNVFLNKISLHVINNWLQTAHSPHYEVSYNFLFEN